MWLLADMKNVMADLQVSNSWSFGNQRWLGLSLLQGLPSLLAHVCWHAAVSCAWICFQVSSEVTPGCRPAVQEGPCLGTAHTGSGW